MGAIFIQDDDVVDYTPSTDLPAGAVVVQNDLVGVTRRPIPANTPGSLAVEGIIDFPKATTAGSALASGILIYWHADIQQANGTSANGKLLGKSTRAAADADTHVRVRLMQ